MRKKTKDPIAAREKAIEEIRKNFSRLFTQFHRKMFKIFTKANG